MIKVLTYIFAGLTIMNLSDARVSDNSGYKIKQVKKMNSWYIIYARNNRHWYKIVSKIEGINSSNCQKVSAGKTLDLKLVGMRDSVLAPLINGIKLDPAGYSGCYQFDSETNICLEPEKGIYEIHFSSNLKGLCYIGD